MHQAGSANPWRVSRSLESVTPWNPELEVLLGRVQRAVRRRTSDRVRGLEVLVHAGVLVLRGRCATYYCKQLAQTAAMEAAPQFQVVNQIEVW